jgi:hypothetical protein
LFVNDPADGVGAPRFRFLPDANLPDGLVTNQIGWRGAPIQSPRGDKSVRIVFVGSLTVVDAHYLPFSHSEFVGHWLNLWAASQGSDVRFEVLNAGRESIMSNDIAAVVHNEVLPLRPDLVIYYEGGTSSARPRSWRRSRRERRFDRPRRNATRHLHGCERLHAVRP